jgi:CRP-like cAMP-binding protein
MVERAVPVSSPSPTPFRNLLLATLPKHDQKRLSSKLDVVPMTLKDRLHTPEEVIEYVYFPGGGFCSLVTALHDGRMVEVATVGREGSIGVAAVVDGRSACVAMVQGAADTCYRMPMASFELLHRYAQALTGCIMQSTACNAVHHLEQRLARWLLLAHDRMAADSFSLTQEFAAMMLGASRQTVTVVAGTLQKAGLITYQRGRVTIVDRKQLEAASCECYRATTRLLQSVIAAPRR